MDCLASNCIRWVQLNDNQSVDRTNEKHGTKNSGIKPIVLFESDWIFVQIIWKTLVTYIPFLEKPKVIDVSFFLFLVELKPTVES